jgi:hypothetical protein
LIWRGSTKSVIAAPRREISCFPSQTFHLSASPPRAPLPMTPLLSLSLLLSSFLSLTTCQHQNDPDFSLSQPFTSGTQPFDAFGSAMSHSDTIVLTPHSPPHVIGAVWSKKPNPHVYWEADFSFRVTGAERGGTGLAFWYTAKRGLGGNVFGSVDQWDGLGVFFDANTGGKVSFWTLCVSESGR